MLTIGYMVALSLLITLVLFFFINKISYWILLINIVLAIVDFFFLYSELANWYYTMPIFIVTLYLIIILSYEIKLLTDLGDFQGLLEGSLDNLTLSTLCSLGYSLAFYKDIYVMRQQALRRANSTREDKIDSMRHQQGTKNK